MEFRETLLAAQKNQQQKSSDSSYYKAKFDPPKKEQRQKDKLSANIQKFLAKKDEEEKRKKLETQRKRDELLAMRDPKAMRKIQKTLKTIKSANKSVLEDAIDNDNTAFTLHGPDQPDQDDYGYESQEAAALYAKMMQKYSKLPEEPKFPTGNSSVKKDLNGTRERVRQALQHEEEPVPHKRRRRTGDVNEKEPPSPPRSEIEKKKEEKPKIRRPMPPPMDFNQLLKLAEQKKSLPVETAPKKVVADSEPERLMTKKQKREYEEELIRRQKRQEYLDAQKSGKVGKDKIPIKKLEKNSEKKLEQISIGFGRIPKVGEKARTDSPKRPEVDKEKPNKDRLNKDKDRIKLIREQSDLDKARQDRLEKLQAEKDRIEKDIEKERLEKLKAERDRINRDIERLSKDRERLEKEKSKLGNSREDKINNKSVDKSRGHNNGAVKKNIDLKSQNTYRIDKNAHENKNINAHRSSDSKYLNGHSSNNKISSDMPKNGKPIPRLNEKRPGETNRTPMANKSQQEFTKPKVTNTFDFDKHVKSLNGQRPNGKKVDGRPGEVRRKAHPDDRKPKRRVLDSDSEYDSEMDDFIDDGDENLDYSTHIKEIFGYDKSKYRDMDDDDDPEMESSFSRQQREEYISKKIGIMEDLEDMKLEAMEKQRKQKKGRRISD